METKKDEMIAFPKGSFKVWISTWVYFTPDTQKVAIIRGEFVGSERLERFLFSRN